MMSVVLFAATMVRRKKNQEKKQGLWSITNMEKAVREFRKGNSIRRAAEMYDVPKSTLARRLSGLVDEKAPASRPRIFTNDEECEIVKYIYLTWQIVVLA